MQRREADADALGCCYEGFNFFDKFWRSRLNWSLKRGTDEHSRLAVL